MNTQQRCEIQFLRYLDALDNGNADAIADFLAQAEHDPQLTHILLDYHAQEEAMNLKKIIPYPLNKGTKRKRKNSEWRINPLVASLLLVLIGFVAGFGVTRMQGSNPMAAVIPPTVPITTFGYGGHVLENLDANVIDAMQTADMTWVKYQVRYRQGDSADAIRTQIDTAHANSFRVMLQVVGLPSEINNDNYFDSYGRFVGELAGYGADAIEIWNEPNIDREWPIGEIDPTLYTELLRVAYMMIKEQNPNTFVITAGLAPTGAEDAFPNEIMNDDRYLRGLVEAGALDYADCVGIHYVEGVVPPSQTTGDTRDDHYTRYYQTMVDTYWDIINGQLPLCFTELGYLAGDVLLPEFFQWAQDTSRAEQAQWVDEAVQLAAASEQVRILILWSMNNYADVEIGYTLMLPDGSCAACDALGDVEPPVRGPAGETCYARLVNPDNFVTLRQADLVDSPTRIGVNYSFRIIRPARLYEGEYYILFDNAAAIMAMDDVELIGDCTNDSYPITAYPNIELSDTRCIIALVDDMVTLSGIRREERERVFNNTMQVTGTVSALGRVDYWLQVQVGQFNGIISPADYTVTGYCTGDSFPMTVMPPQE